MRSLIIDRADVYNQLIAGPLEGIESDLKNCTSGETAMILLNQEKFDCICLATTLEDVDGIDLCKKIRSRQNYRHIPIFLLTNENEPQLIQRASEAGITDIFLKEKADELVNYLARFAQIYDPIEGKILYVEDDESQRLIIEHMLRLKKLTVDSFETAEAAFKQFLKHDYDLLITDIVLMGEMSGIMLINKVRRTTSAKGDIPILAITGYDDVSRRASLYRMGINDYITKPVVEEELVSRVRNLVSRQHN